eukprot:169211-Pelagomonas_calceolata.AAC.3
MVAVSNYPQTHQTPTPISPNHTHLERAQPHRLLQPQPHPHGPLVQLAAFTQAGHHEARACVVIRPQHAVLHGGQRKMKGQVYHEEGHQKACAHMGLRARCPTQGHHEARACVVVCTQHADLCTKVRRERKGQGCVAAPAIMRLAPTRSSVRSMPPCSRVKGRGMDRGVS